MNGDEEIMNDEPKKKPGVITTKQGWLERKLEKLLKGAFNEERKEWQELMEEEKDSSMQKDDYVITIKGERTRTMSEIGSALALKYNKFLSENTKRISLQKKQTKKEMKKK